MKRSRRKVLRLGLSATAVPLVSRMSFAQSFPSRIVRIVIPFAAGGGGDALGRPLANRLSEIWGQQVVIENKAGAAGNIAAQAVAQSPPDGHTLLLGAAFLAINPHLYPSSSFDPITDLSPVTLVCVIPNLMIVPNSSPAKTVKEFIDYAKANRGKISFGSSGVGSGPHLTGELFKRAAGIEMTHIPYRGANLALNDLVPGRIDAMFTNIPGVLPHVRSGSVRGVAVTASKRSPFAPEIPTIGESLPKFEVMAWWGLFAPSKTSPTIVAKIQKDAAEALTHPLVRERYEAAGSPPMSSTPVELAALLKADLQRWGPIIKEAGIRPE